MGLTVQMADGSSLHPDRSRHLAARRHGVNNPVLVGGDPQLFNPYEVILVNPDKHPHVNVAAANAFIDWLIGDDGKEAIAGYRVNGEQLFVPAPGPTN